MKLKDIADMEEYLEHRCYCPHEVYEMNCIFYNIFYPDQDCAFIGSYREGQDTFVYVTATNEYGIDKILAVVINGGVVYDCTMFDATEHNIDQIKKRANGEIKSISYDYYKDNSPVKKMKDILTVVDAVVTS